MFKPLDVFVCDFEILLNLFRVSVGYVKRVTILAKSVFVKQLLCIIVFIERVVVLVYYIKSVKSKNILYFDSIIHCDMPFYLICFLDLKFKSHFSY